ncbi:MAG: Uma2 family endonuclease [Lewinellaceae bacterium]|nr:Uma2 family endonuclease [Lewinellaceae bacterium]MCB9285810.1 Uma2 family endonuclease [Lewinellaceae bacterium]
MPAEVATESKELIVSGVVIKGLLHRMSMEEFYAFCALNRELRIERDSEGNVIIMPPVYTKTGFYEGEAFGELRSWNKKNGEPGKVFSPSAGFTLPNGAVRSADASWLSNEKWKALSEEERKSFAPVVPEFIIEVRSSTDKEDKLFEKMEEWVENGALLAWLIDPILEQARVYRADGSISVIKSFDEALSGEEVLPGFAFALSSLKS